MTVMFSKIASLVFLLQAYWTSCRAGDEPSSLDDVDRGECFSPENVGRMAACDVSIGL
jgi:hypothetical protein